MSGRIADQPLASVTREDLHPFADVVQSIGAVASMPSDFVTQVNEMKHEIHDLQIGYMQRRDQYAMPLSDLQVLKDETQQLNASLARAGCPADRALGNFCTTYTERTKAPPSINSRAQTAD